ncbi:hypothetical protein [Maledivibacter halophilus]|uniref:Uncharacterized protein n=1 Tax=Maledivibacter halophilus TaxID=36842 RepID=A0A1T5LUU8_9FIRM|nr:hypothetical protein [Maledivibacter halophilus]SKC79760.1 hypothetical protein SAMN02194393_03356 [Maledivibacter halophilus]
MKGKKILIVLCGITVVTFTVAALLKDDIKVISLSKDQYEYKDNGVEVVDGENFIKYVSDINDIRDIIWINEDLVEFKGKVEDNDEFESFQFDYSNKLFSEDKNAEKDEFYRSHFKEKIQFVKSIDEDNYVIYIEGKDKNGLFHLCRDEEPVFLASSIKVDDKLLFKMSNNNRKIAYYDGKQNIIKIYDFNTKKIAEIEHDINNEIFKDFKSCISFSHEAGYIAVSNVNRENFKESNFSVYGADSGKAYAENLLGINPVWGKDNLIIAFTYLEDNSQTNTKEKKSRDIVGDRVGLFNLKTRKTKFIQNMGKGYKVIKPAVWSNNNQIIIAVGKYLENENIYAFSKVCSYNIKRNELSDLESYFKDIIKNSNDFEITAQENDLYISFYGKDQENIVKVIDISNRDEKDFRNLQRFNTNIEGTNKLILSKSLAKDKFLYVHNNGVYVSDLNSNYVKYKANGTINKIYESPDKSKLFIISEFGEKLELAIVKL